ncbi:MAG: sigma-70 family RNA polymerase sigma factor [Deltaproteobacteria bacterium]|nr:sigma-70 family RNA polymerase sigma factor [Deltaproteobacteria bacterium]
MLERKEPAASTGSPSASDSDLVESAVENLRRGIAEEESFRILYRRYARPVEAFLAKRVSSRQDCHDLVQETFLRVYQGIGGFRGDASFATWVFRIAYFTYLKWRRNRSGEPELSVQASSEARGDKEEESAREFVPPTEPGQLSGLLATERRAVLRGAVENLPDQMRRCTILRIYQERKYKEIAELMGISIQTVKVHLFQARKRISEALGEESPRGDR